MDSDEVGGAAAAVAVVRPTGAVDMQASWMQGAAASHTVVEQLVETSVTLSAESRPAGGDDITAHVIAKQFPDADVLAAYRDVDEDAWLEVGLTLSWPFWLTRVGDPTGCDEWIDGQRLCILRFHDSPPGPGREIGLTFAVPDWAPFPGRTGEVGVSASRVDVMSDDDGDFSIAEVPTSTVIPSSAPFEVYQPILKTDVTLSSYAGWPGGDDVVATFSVERISGTSGIDLDEGVAEVRLSWPDFLTPVSPPASVCTDFTPDPGSSSGVCKAALVGIGPPGPPVEFEMVFAMPPEGAGSAQAGVIAIAGVSLTVPDGDGGDIVYDDRFILPSSADFLIDSGAYTVDVVLDRSVSTVGGARLYGEVHVTFDHAVPGDRDAESVGIAIDWPDFLDVVDPPGIVGCDEWVGDICYLTQLREVGDEQVVQVWFDMPAVTGGVGEITAAGARLCDGPPTDCTDMPAEWIGTDAEPFEVYAPLVKTDVTLSSYAGWPGGDDVVATFSVERISGTSGIDLDEGVAEVRLSWPDFLTPVSPPASVCTDFTPDPGSSSGVCKAALVGIGPPGPPVEFEMVFAMPPEGAGSAQAGVIAIAGVSLTVPDGDGGDIVYDDRFILPSSADFLIDSGAYTVDVVLDRSVSTVGGARLYGEVHVTFDHAVPGDRDAESVGIAIDWPDFLDVVDPPGIVGCDEWVGDICYLTQLREVGDEQVVQVWFDMPAVTGGVGEITAAGARLCDGPPTDCTDMPAEWIGTDAEPFEVVDPRIEIDVEVDRDTGWTGGQPITATVTVTRTGSAADVPLGSIAERLPGLVADLKLQWPDFLTPVTITGCDAVVVAGDCRISRLDEVASRQLSLTFAMPGVEDARTTPAVASKFPATGEVRVRGAAFSYLAAPPTPLPAGGPGIPPIIDGPGTADGSGTGVPTLPRCSVLVLLAECVILSPVVVEPAVADPAAVEPAVPDPAVVEPAVPDPAVPDPADPDAVETVVSALRPERIGSDSARVSVIQPKVTVVPRVARPGEVVTIYVESLPPAAAATTSWSTTMSPVVPLVLPPEVTFAISRQLIVRRAALGLRDITVHSTDGRFGDFRPAMPLLVVARSTVADELVGRGG